MSAKNTPEPKKIQSKEGQIGKYLTDIKELPPFSKEVVVKDLPKVNKDVEANVNKKTVSPGAKSTVLPQSEPSLNVAKDSRKLSEPEEESDREEKRPHFTFKDVILGIINFISVILIIFLLTKLPQKATEYKTEKIEEIRNQVNPQAEFGNIAEDKERSAKLEGLFLDESGIVHFVSDVEKLKSETPSINKVTFASPKPVKDELGILGIPVTIELVGSWDTFAPALEKIQSLPYLFRVISLESGPAKDDPSVLILNYGVFLYVKDGTGVN